MHKVLRTVHTEDKTRFSLIHSKIMKAVPPRFPKLEMGCRFQILTTPRRIDHFPCPEFGQNDSRSEPTPCQESRADVMPEGNEGKHRMLVAAIRCVPPSGVAHKSKGYNIVLWAPEAEG
jgi:hypothetical protein